MFNLEDVISNWKKSLHKNPSLEDGYIEELESHLRDKIEFFINRGMNASEAFKKASEEIGDVEYIGKEYLKTDNLHTSKNTAWNNKSGVFTLPVNYVKVALRMLRKHKSHSFINIAGFTLGFTVFVLIANFVKFQLSYDQFHKNKNNIYRISTTNFASTPDLWAPGLKESFPEVRNFVRVQPFGETLIENDKNNFYESNGLYADSSFFNIFSFKLDEGNPNTALVAPYSIVITRQLAIKIFGNSSPVGKTVFINDGDSKKDYKVTGLINEVPANSHFTFSFLVSEATNKAQWVNNWKWLQFYTYLQLSDEVNISELTDKINPWLKHKISDPNWSTIVQLQPITSIHLHSHLNKELGNNQDNSTIYLFSIIAILILLIAVVNYINLTTARAVNRAKEVALRKSMGAKRIQLIFQFLGETILYSIIVFAISVLAVELLMPSFNNLFQLNLEQTILNDPGFILLLFGLIIFIGILSGIYPAFVLSAFQPTSILKGTVKFSNRNFLKRTIVVFQFAITSFLIISSLLIYQQMQYINSKDKGFNTDQIISFPLRSDNISKNLNTFENELNNNPDILSTSLSANLPGGGDWGIPFQAEGKDPADLPSARILAIDQDFIPTYKMELVQGRNFNKEISSDKNSYIINESMAREIGWNDPLSKKISFDGIGRKWGNIIGVVKDFNYRSLHKSIDPLIMFVPPDFWYSKISIKVKGADIGNTVSYIENLWKKFDRKHPFTFTFMDKRFEDLYLSDQRNMKIITMLTAIAIFIACLGLYSMMMHTLNNRTKEIGIRKILGAKTGNVMSLVSKEFLILMLISNLFAWPAAYYFLTYWLQDFAYRVNISPFIFLIGSLFSIAIAFSSIIYKILKAANANPVNSLRYE